MQQPDAEETVPAPVRTIDTVMGALYEVATARRLLTINDIEKALAADDVVVPNRCIYGAAIRRAAYEGIIKRMPGEAISQRSGARHRMVRIWKSTIFEQ